MTSNIFIEKSKNVHNNKYDYSLVDYKHPKLKIKIICLKHGMFEIKPYHHLNGSGCPKCAGKNKTTKEFIDEANEIHGNKYDYSLVEYKNAITKIKIICPIHGIFEQKPNNHLNNQSCPKCYYTSRTSNNDIFIKKAKSVHEDKYDYSEVEYVGAYINIKIRCFMHGIFEQTPANHIHGTGCPKCKQSRGEIKIEHYLLNNNINFVYQKTFNKCKNKICLPFDFYLPEYNILIEYDGKQHFEINEYFGGETGFKLQQINDKIKNDFCAINDINLIRIKYNENIEDKLKSLFGKNILEIV